MYGENVNIYVNGKLITIFVPCEPKMPKDKLKTLAVNSGIQQ
jgi:hypothetical protein